MVKNFKVTELAPMALQFAKYVCTDYAYCEGVVTHTIIRMEKGPTTIDVMIPHDGSETIISWDDGFDDEEGDKIDWEKVAERDLAFAKRLDESVAKHLG